jgi:AmiR/NasT family two-component response regulator
MKDEHKTKEQLINEMVELRQRIAELETSGTECKRRVLISTGYTARGLAQELVAEGALGALETPFQIRDFAAAVRAALDKP